MLGFLKSKKKTGQTKILLVDDEASIVEIVRRRLEAYGWEVITAADGKEGLERAITEKPDLIVLDIGMPVMSGHEMLDCLRNDPGSRATPVIVCTKSDRIQDITMATSMGVAGYVTKPFNCAEFVDRIMATFEIPEKIVEIAAD